MIYLLLEDEEETKPDPRMTSKVEAVEIRSTVLSFPPSTWFAVGDHLDLGN